MIRCTLMALAVLTALAACKTTEVAEPTPNPGSHPAPWVHNVLLPGRTIILFDKRAYPPDWKNWFVTRAAYHTEDRRTLECRGAKRRYREETSDGYRYSGSGETGAAAVRSVDGHHQPVFYNPATGRLHHEMWNDRAGNWLISADGWIQKGWPRLMADACPDLTEEILADGGWINEKQTHPTIYRMLEQDPDAPLHLPDAPSASRAGIAAARSSPWHWCFESPSKPVLPEHCFPEGENAPGYGVGLPPGEAPAEAADRLRRTELAAALKAAHGHIVEDRLGRAYVLALGPKDEFWEIDGRGHLTDVGYLTWNPATQILELDWELKDDVANFHYRPGDPLPVTDTGRRHPIFALADWLVEDAEDVVLPYMGRQALFRFLPAGELIARGQTRDLAGSWTVSRGLLVLEIDGLADRAGYAWQDLIRYLSTHAGYEASVG